MCKQAVSLCFQSHLGSRIYGSFVRDLPIPLGRFHSAPRQTGLSNIIIMTGPGGAGIANLATKREP